MRLRRSLPVTVLMPAVAVIMLLAVACGGGEPTAAPAPAAPAASTQPAAPAPATAEAPDPYYRGKTIRLLVNWPPGSSADLFARLIARHYRRFIEGEPKLVVLNKAGASGLVGALSVYRAKPNGLTVGVFTAVNAGNQLMRRGWTYDLRKARMIIGFQGQTTAWYIWGDGPYDRIQEAVGQGSAGGPVITVGTDDVCSMNVLRFRALKEWLDLPLDVKYGLPGNRAEAIQQLERGDVNSNTSSMWYTVPNDRPGWLKDRVLEVFTLMNPKGTAEFLHNGEIDVPEDTMWVSDLLTPEQQKLYRQFSADLLGPQHRSMQVPPGTPDEMVQVLRDAAWEMFHDAEFLKDYERIVARGPLDVRRGAEMEELLESALGDLQGLFPRIKEFMPECLLNSEFQ